MANVSSAAGLLTATMRRGAARLGLGASQATRSLPIRGDRERISAIWSDEACRDAVLGGLPARRGSILFGSDQADWGTTVTIRLELDVPLPRSAAQPLAGKAIRRLKALAETGEVPTTARNPSARSMSEGAGG
jgi:hypothetical protein